MPAQSRQRRRQPVRSPQRRQAQAPQRTAVQPVDYSADYAYVRADLVRILIWGGLLLAAMIAAAFFM